MARCVMWIGGLALALSLVSCGTEQPAIDRVGVRVIDKSIFEGSWYMSRTVIDVDFEASGLGTFPGDAASDSAGSFTALPRIRWVIEKDYLIAYRDYELTLGGQGEPRTGEDERFEGQPVAAFEIEGHFDLQREYNTVTGEERNVVVENASDRRWFEREFMRVDFSHNLLPGYYGQTADLYSVLGYWEREPAALQVQAASVFPDAWRPRFDRMRCTGPEDEDCPAYERDLATDYETGELYHFSFVTQEILSPGTVPDPIAGPVNWCRSLFLSDAPTCSNVTSRVRTSFLKVSDQRQYEPVDWTDSRFDQFGYFRLGQVTYDRSTGDPDDPAFGFTDFLNYSANRHNIWQQWHDENGDPIPYRERDVRQIVWYTTTELPAHLVQPSFDVVGQWNEVFMETVRRLRDRGPPRYPDVDCQRDDPDAYCFCQSDPETGDTINPTCPGRYDPFQSPEDAEAAGVVRPYDCYVEVPEGAEPDLQNDKRVSDSDFNGWFDARMVGDECVTVLRVNACNKKTIAENDGTREGLDCQQRGDLRLKFLSYVEQPGTGFLGIATLRGDPITGEIIAGDANIGGPALDSFRTSVLRQHDVINGTLDERELVTGEDVRSYFEALDQVELPPVPRRDFSVAMRGGQSVVDTPTAGEIHARMDKAMTRIERLQGAEGRANTFSDRRAALIGSDLERRLLSNPETLMMAGIQDPNVPVDEAILDLVSPFRVDVYDKLAEVEQRADKLSRANVMMPNEFTDDSVQWFVDNHEDWSRARLEFGINRLLYRQTQLHELGHCLGLRHNFGSSADTDHYHPQFYAIAERFPLPDPTDYDTDGTPGLSPDEAVAYEEDYTQMRHYRESAGIDGWMNSSVMEYSANWYQRLQPLGRYDRAAVMFGYGDLIEAYRGRPRPQARRDIFTNYHGGEECNRDRDCPFSLNGARSDELKDTNIEQGLTQRCLDNPRASSARLCSSFAEDIAASAADGGRHRPLSYRFCSDRRATGGSTAPGTLGWCNRFDEGDSYREIVRNVIESYERMYVFTNFRRFRRSFDFSGYLGSLVGRRLVILQNIYQNLVHQYVSDPEFRDSEGAFGFYDEFLAAADILNFYARILAQPRIGGYVWNDRVNRFELNFASPDAPSADLGVDMGTGRFFNSDYQRGLSGIQRLERIGSFADKLYTMQLMTLRGWQPGYGSDIAFYTNFYDLFPNEVQQIFSGMIRGFPEAYMPRIVCEDPANFPACDSPRVVYMDFYRGDCSQESTCRPNPAEVTYAGLPVLDAGSSFLLQVYAAVYGLSEFPVYFDTTFQNQMFICIEGQGDCFEPDPSTEEGVHYVRHHSDRYKRNFLAWQVDPAVGVGEQTSIGFEMVKEARDLDLALDKLLQLRNGTPPYDPANLTQEDLDELAAIDYELPSGSASIENEIERIEFRLLDLESFFNQIIQLQSEYGIRDFGRVRE